MCEDIYERCEVEDWPPSVWPFCSSFMIRVRYCCQFWVNLSKDECYV